MPSRKTTTLTAILAAVLAFLLHGQMPLGQFIWPAADVGMAEPNAIQGVLFLLYTVIAATVFGLGVAFLMRGRPLLRRAAPAGARVWGPYLAISWLLVSWVPHDNLHMFFGFNVWGLLFLEYVFHMSIMAAGLVLAGFYLRVLQNRAGSPAGRAARRAGGASA